MGAEGDMNKQTTTGGGAVSNGTVNDGVAKGTTMERDNTTKPGGGEKGSSAPKGMLTDDEIATTLAAASEKLQAAHREEQKKRKSRLSRFLRALYPKKFIGRLRDFYIDTCMMAAEKGDFADLVAGHPGMYYGDTVFSRNISQRKDREHEEIVQASLSRQASVSLSRQHSKQSQSGALKMTRNTSTGNSGLSRNASAGISGFSRQESGTGRSVLGRNYSAKKHVDSNLFSAGRNTFMNQLNPAALNQNKNVASLHKSEIGKPEPPGATAIAGDLTKPVR